MRATFFAVQCDEGTLPREPLGKERRFPSRVTSIENGRVEKELAESFYDLEARPKDYTWAPSVEA